MIVALRKVFYIFLMAVIMIECVSVSILYPAADSEFRISDYLEMLNEKTDIYDKYYVTPDIDSIVSDQKRNLLYIYLESMETTYASKQDGGEQQVVSYIPNLTKIANENISFSNSEKLGGFHSSIYTTWTMGALFASQSGVPLSFPVRQNDRFTDRTKMAGGLITLGDILEEKGYYQEFLCGSDAGYGGRKEFFTQHGNFEIYDWFSAVEDGYVKEDEFVWWGLEDKNLYKIAKDELTRMSKLDKPFHLSMLTVDTHFVGGWICSLCEEKYDSVAANAISCGDRQIFDFLEWCSEQAWYENTTIVIQGDHPRMDSELEENVADYDRVVYNCFINPVLPDNEIKQKNRVFTSLDMYPTVLSSLGYTIPDDRLGLGTNMFSDKKTLSEELGYDYVNTETGKYSVYYINHFS